MLLVVYRALIGDYIACIIVVQQIPHKSQFKYILITNLWQRMGLIANFFLYFDQFKAPATLRTNGNGETSSICTGVFSFILACIFLWLLIAKAIEITAFKKIEVSSFIEDDLSNLKKTEVMFAINIFEEHGKLINNPYFQFYATVQNNKEEILQEEKLKLCELTQWSGIDQNILIQYYDIENWLCPSKPLPVQGFRTGKNATVINFKINYCLTQVYCTTITDIKDYIQKKKTYGYMSAEFLFRDVGFTLGKENSTIPLFSYFKGTFTETSGILMDIWLADYEIETDVSFAPWENKKTEKGSYIMKEQHFPIDFDSNSNENFLVELNVKFTSKTMKAERKYGKIDDVISYFGGLLGIIVFAFSFFIGGYNQYRYELKVAEGCFNYDQEGNQFKANQMNFFVYVGYTIFDWIRTILCCFNQQWKYMNKLDETREQANSQLDVFFLYKKLQYLQDLSKVNLTEDEAICLSISTAPTLGQVKIKRSFLQYHDDIIQGEKAILLKNVYPKNQDSSELQKEEKVKALGIKELRQVVQEYHLNNQQEFQKLDELQLEQQQKYAEREISRAFLALPQSKRGRIQGNYPIKILYCLLRTNSSRQMTSIDQLIRPNEEKQSLRSIRNSPTIKQV